MPEPAIREKFKQKILLAALILAVITIPLFNQLNSIALIFFVTACVIQRPLRVTVRQLRRPSLWVLPVSYFLWLACSYFWDASGGFFISDIERYGTLFFIPPVIAIIPRLSQKFLKITCMSFVAVVCAVCVICLIKSYAEYQLSGDYRVFFYHYLGGQMGLNGIFLSNYCLASIIWILYFSFMPGHHKSRTLAALLFVLIAFLFIMVLLLSSKLIIFLMLLTLLFLACYIGYMRGFLMKALVIVSLLIVAGIVSIYNLSYVRWRLGVTSVKKYSGTVDNNNGLSIRLLMWGNAWDLIQQRPFLGYGVRGARAKEVEAFKKENFLLGYREGYHSHNQYLESALMGGLPAFLLFVGMLAQLWGRAFRLRNILLLLLLFHFTCQCVIESAYEVQQELVFYIFFLFLFYYHSPAIGQKNLDVINGNDALL